MANFIQTTLLVCILIGSFGSAQETTCEEKVRADIQFCYRSSFHPIDYDSTSFKKCCECVELGKQCTNAYVDEGDRALARVYEEDLCLYHYHPASPSPSPIPQLPSFPTPPPNSFPPTPPSPIPQPPSVPPSLTPQPPSPLPQPPSFRQPLPMPMPQPPNSPPTPPSPIPQPPVVPPSPTPNQQSPIPQPPSVPPSPLPQPPSAPKSEPPSPIPQPPSVPPSPLPQPPSVPPPPKSQPPSATKPQPPSPLPQPPSPLSPIPQPPPSPSPPNNWPNGCAYHTVFYDSCDPHPPNATNSQASHSTDAISIGTYFGYGANYAVGFDAAGCCRGVAIFGTCNQAEQATKRDWYRTLHRRCS